MTLYARVMTYGLFAGIFLTLPLWPPMLTIMTGQMKHTRRYLRTIRKGFTHLHALIKCAPYIAILPAKAINRYSKRRKTSADFAIAVVSVVSNGAACF